MTTPAIEEALLNLSGGELVDPVVRAEKIREASTHLATVIELASVCYVGEDVDTAKLTGVLDTLSPKTSSERFTAALDYADQSLDAEGRSQVYTRVVKCLVGSFGTISNRNIFIDDKKRDESKVNRNISRIDTVLAILTTDIDEEPVIDACDASNILSEVVDIIHRGSVELYGRDEKGRDVRSVVDQIQSTRLEIFEKAGHKSKRPDELFSQALQIYARQEISFELRKRALSYAIANCPSMKDVSLEDIGCNTRYPTHTALKLLASTDDPGVVALALEMAIVDFTPFINNLKRSQAYLEDKKANRQGSAYVLDDLSNSSLLRHNQQLEELIAKVTSRLETYDDEIGSITHEQNGFKYEIREGVREVQSAIIEKLLPLLSSKRGQSLFGLVYASLDDDMARPACSKDSFLKQCIDKLKEAYKYYAQHGKQEYDSDQLRNMLVFLNGLKQPVEINK